MCRGHTDKINKASLYKMPSVHKLKEPKNRAAMPINRKDVPMELKAFSIRDNKGEVFNLPFFKKQFGEAERDFTELCKDEKSMLNKYPEDFDLYHIGEYDDQTGKLLPLDTPRHIVKAIQCIVRSQPQQ